MKPPERFTVEQVQAILDELDQPWQAMVLLAFYAGLRRGQHADLHEQCIDWRHGRLFDGASVDSLLRCCMPGVGQGAHGGQPLLRLRCGRRRDDSQLGGGSAPLALLVAGIEKEA